MSRLECPDGRPSLAHFERDLYLLLQQHINGVPARHIAAIGVEHAQELMQLRQTPTPASVRCLSTLFNKSLEYLSWAIGYRVSDLVKCKATAQGLAVAEAWPYIQG